MQPCSVNKKLCHSGDDPERSEGEAEESAIGRQLRGAVQGQIPPRLVGVAKGRVLFKLRHDHKMISLV